LNTTKIPITKKRKAESLLSAEVNLAADSDEEEDFSPLF
jgi:hypothetical protein